MRQRLCAAMVLIALVAGVLVIAAPAASAGRWFRPVASSATWTCDGATTISVESARRLISVTVISDRRPVLIHRPFRRAALRSYDVDVSGFSGVRGVWVRAGDWWRLGRWIPLSAPDCTPADLDLDGIDAAVEDAGPNNGDGNRDGVADSAQANVASLPAPDGTSYVTVAAPAGTQLVDVATSATPPGDAPAEDFPYGVVSYTVSGVAPGSTVAMELSYPADAGIDAVAKYGPPDAGAPALWFAPPDATVVTEPERTVATFSITDGGIGDNDGAANGSIVDPVGPTAGAYYDLFARFEIVAPTGKLCTAGLYIGVPSRQVCGSFVGRSLVFSPLYGVVLSLATQDEEDEDGDTYEQIFSCWRFSSTGSVMSSCSPAPGPVGQVGQPFSQEIVMTSGDQPFRVAVCFDLIPIGDAPVIGDGSRCGDVDGDGFAVGTGDCDETDATVYRGAPELADGIDNDCNGIPDDDVAPPDGDGDGVGDAVDNCPADVNADQADLDGDGVGDVCDLSDDRDVDGDLVTVAGGDCDDGDASVFPGAVEVAYDGVDQDCDGVDLTDVDGDGFDGPSGTGADCDDGDVAVNPDATEIANGIDDNCNGEVDESVGAAPLVCQGRVDNLGFLQVWWQGGDSPTGTYVETNAAGPLGTRTLVQPAFRAGNQTLSVEFTVGAETCTASVDDPVDPSADTDGDGVLDGTDNCLFDANPGQERFEPDSNPFGLPCSDFDADGVVDLTDNCRSDSNPSQEDADSDGIGDGCEDDDGDGFPVPVDCDDTDPTIPSVELPDGVDNDCDGDIDNFTCVAMDLPDGSVQFWWSTYPDADGLVFAPYTEFEGSVGELVGAGDVAVLDDAYGRGGWEGFLDTDDGSECYALRYPALIAGLPGLS